MGSSIHFKTPRGNLGRSMRHINGIYTQRYNKVEKRDGSIFRGRYKAILVDQDSYLLQVSRYIHLNPISAKITDKPQNYHWSSYQMYIKKVEGYGWLNSAEIKGMLAHRKSSLAL